MKKILILFMLVMVLIESYSQDKPAAKSTFTLKEAQDFAAENAYSIKEVKYNISQAEQQVREYISIGLPQINIQGSFNQFAVIPTSVLPNFIGPAITGALVQAGALPPSALNSPPNPPFIYAQFGTKYNTQVGASGSQLLFDGSFFVGIQASKAFVQLTKEGQRKAEIDVKDNVTQAYFTVLIVQETKKLLEQSLINLEKTQMETKAFYKSGFAEETDVDQFDILISNLNNQITKVKANIENAKGLLKFQMGMSVKDPIDLTDNLETITQLSNNPSLLNPILDPTTNIDHKLLTEAMNVQKLNATRIKMGYLPSARLIGNASTQALRSKFDMPGGHWYPTLFWGVNLNIPVFDGFMKDAGIKKAKLDVAKTRNTLDQLEQGLNLQLQTAKADFISSDNQLKNEEKSLTLAKKVRDKALIKYKEGVGSSLEVTQAENQLVATQGNYFQALMSKLTAKAKLDKILGAY